MKIRCLLIVSVLAVLLSFAGCAKNVTAPIPGQINTFDGYAYRTLSDAQTALQLAKAWETCSDQSYPATVTFDGKTFQCSQFQGPFPKGARASLYQAEKTYDTAEAAWQIYHAGASGNASGLQSALTQLVADLTSYFTQAGASQ